MPLLSPSPGFTLIPNPLVIVTGGELIGTVGAWFTIAGGNPGDALLKGAGASYAYLAMTQVGAGAAAKLYARAIGSTADAGTGLTTSQAISLGMTVTGFPRDTVGAAWVIVDADGKFQVYNDNFTGGSSVTIQVYGYQ